jgi:hypothetical protein
MKIHLIQSHDCKVDAALTALDTLAITVSDEIIDRMVLEDLTDGFHVGLGLTHEGALAIARTFLGRGLRVARDNWLVPSPWISVEERLPELGAKVLVLVTHDDDPFIASRITDKFGVERWYAECPEYGSIEGDAYWYGFFEDNASKVTHYRPLPPNPTK